MIGLSKEKTSIWERYNKSNIWDISECYEKYSIEKLNAQNKIMEEMKNNNGREYKILSYNTFMFTCAYKYNIGNKIYLVYHTPSRKMEFLVAVE